MNAYKIGNTPERFAGRFGLVEVLVRNAHVLAFCTLASRSALDRNTHNLLSMGVSGNNVYPCMVHERTLEAVLGKPVEDKGFSEIPCDLCVTRALVDLHVIWLTYD